MATLHGPHKISPQLQLKIPRDVAQELHQRAGDEIFLRLSDDDPGVLLVIPGEIVERRYHAGEELEADQWPRAAALDVSTASGSTSRDEAADSGPSPS